ncbi:aromatic acid exporter family protein [Paenibacillus sp. LHD-117]|uniref:aromatic acid exporter family protein n=1 Tax=Paenibacillus sp. LHD-117 TaxID=3071412 RepID=UPI0027DFEED8|nr:aromatic acid exporter family protein [Paenibacillus sp. LHD-117]MDQ6420398.1 aromatic acid exporter family protein [Paenibacillus sp. LHD-117]
MTFGARMLKTGIAVTLALYVSTWLNFSPPVIAAVAAIFALQPSIYRSWRHFLEQVQANTLGAVIALLAGTYFSNEPIAIGVVCILVIMLCMKIGMSDSIALTLVTVVAVMEASGQWEFALNRFLLSMIGILSAFLLNIAFMPPDPKEQFNKHIHAVFNQLSLLLRTAISDEIKEKVFREQKQELEDGLRSLSDKYKLLEEELKKPKRAKYRHTRQVVVYKQLLHNLQKGYEVLEAVQEHYFQSGRTPDVNKSFDRHLEKLIKFNEHVLLKFEEKVKPGSWKSESIEESNDAFMKHARNDFNEDIDGSLRLFIVAAAIYDYGHQTVRSNRLVERTEAEDQESAVSAG